MKEILAAYNSLYAGREFVYRSKYGQVKGIVESIRGNNSFIFDEDTEKLLIRLKTKQEIGKSLTQNKIEYIAYQPQFMVVSTRGVIYEFKECFFIIEENEQ
jgi:hypothetical protein